MTSIQRRHLAAVAAALAVALGPGCGGPKTSVTQTWKAEVPGAPAPMKTVLVFASRMDDTNRRAFEDAFVKRLASHGVVARPSYELFPGELPDRETARAAAERANIEGILVVTNKGTKEVSTYVPGGYAGDFWGGYYGGPTGMGSYTPGYVATAQIASLEMTLWDTRVENGRLVWSASTSTSEPSPDGKFTKSVVQKVVPEIAKAGLIPPEGR